MAQENQRSVPRLAVDAVEAFSRGRDVEASADVESSAASEVVPSRTTDPIAVGNMAAEGVASYIAAAQHIEASVGQIMKMAETIKASGEALAADLRKRGFAIDRMLSDFAKLATGTEQRMAEERKHLEEIAKDGAR